MIPLKDDIPSRTTPYVTVSIIVVNLLVFLYQLSIGPLANDLFIYRTAAVPLEVTNFVDLLPRSVVPPPLTVFTAMFVHGGPVHLAGNMLFMWIFGDNVEDVFGHAGFLVFYIGTGLVATLAHVLSDASSITPMIGASGAVAGVLGAYFLLFPRANVLTLVFLFFFVTIARIPAVVFLGLWFLFQVLSSGAASGDGGGIAWFAHIGGFAAGIAGVLLFIPGVRKKGLHIRWRR